MKITYVLLYFLICFPLSVLHAQDMTELVSKVKTKIETVTDYTATAVMKVDIEFIKAPTSNVKIYYKKPNKFKLKKEGGISILPKGGLSINLNTVLTINDFVALAAGETKIDNMPVKIVKMLPNDENSDIILSTLYIDEKNLLIRKVVTTTRENGTYELNMTYGAYSKWGLPDKVIFSFNTKDYKLPKGVTLEFDEGKKPSDADKFKNKKGKVEISYSSYIINKGVDDSLFK